MRLHGGGQGTSLSSGLSISARRPRSASTGLASRLTNVLTTISERSADEDMSEGGVGQG